MVFSRKTGAPTMVEEEPLLCPLSPAKYQDKWNKRQTGKSKRYGLESIDILSAIKILQTLSFGGNSFAQSSEIG